MSNRRAVNTLLPWGLLTAAAVLLLALAPHRRHDRVFWGDEGTYAAMAESLALDHDLVFDQRDSERARAGSMGEAPAVIVHRSGDRLFYSKPPLYPMLVAPFFLVAGRYGFWVVNLALLGLAGAIGWYALPRDDSRNWKLATFLGAAAVLPYVAWAMSDVLQFSLAMIAVSAVAVVMRSSLGSGPAGTSGRSWLAVAGICLGLLVVLRQPQVLLVAGVIVALGLSRTWRKARVLAGITLATIAITLALSIATSGTWNPYTATRTSFNSTTGYPQSADSPLVDEQLEAKRATHRYPGAATTWDQRIPWSAAYSLIGRHSGLLLYFPLSLFLLVWGLGSLRLSRRTAAVTAVIVLWAFYLWYRPDNYFGGSAAIGNRYFLPSYGILFAVLAWAPARSRGSAGPYPWWRSALTWSWMVVAALGISALISVRELGARDSSSQNHTAAGLYRLLPYESTLNETEGQRGRFWSGDYLRFVDHRSRVHAENFVLRQEERPAEVVIATHRLGQAFRFEAQGPPGSRLSVRSWVGRRQVDVSDLGSGPVTFEIPKGSPVVHHPMRFDADNDYSIHRLLFRVETPEPEMGVRIRYLGVVGGESGVGSGGEPLTTND